MTDMGGWTADRVETLVRLFDEGQTASTIGRELGVSRCAVLGKLFRLGIRRDPNTVVVRPERKKPQPVAPKFTREVIAAAYNAGIPPKGIAATVGCSTATVYAALRATGTVLRQARNGRVFQQVEANLSQILEWQREGIDGSEIARRIGVNRTSYYIYLRRLTDQGNLSYTTVYAKRFPHLRPILAAEGQEAFVAAARAEDARLRVEADAKVKRARQEKARGRQAAVNAAVQAVAAGADHNNAIRMARASGATLEQIGQSFGITRERVRQIESKNNPFGKLACRFDRALLAQAYAQGSSMEMVARQFGCSVQTVRNAIRAEGVTCRPRQRAQRTPAFGYVWTAQVGGISA